MSLARCEFRPYETANFHFRVDVRALSSTGAHFLPLDGFRPAPGFIDNWKSYYRRSRMHAECTRHVPFLARTTFLSLSFSPPSLPMERWFSSCSRWKKRQLTGYSRGGDPRPVNEVALLRSTSSQTAPDQIRRLFERGGISLFANLAIIEIFRRFGFRVKRDCLFSRRAGVSSGSLKRARRRKK